MKKGWEVKKISQLFEVKSSKRVHKSDWKSEGIPFYRAREVVKLANNGVVANELFISADLYNEYTKDKGVPKKGDIIISAVGTLGKCYLVKDSDKFYFKDASVLWFANTGEVNPNYTEYLFKSDLVKTQIMNGSMGATVGTLTISRAKNIKIPTPPLEEQKQIVAILDKAFKAIDKAKENAEKNLKNAKELFESYLQEVFENKGDDWEENVLGEIADVEYGYTAKSVEKGYYRYVRITDIDKDGELIEENKKYIQHSNEAEIFLANNNDLLMARTGATFAKVLLYKDREPSVFASYLIRIKFKKMVENELYWYFTKTRIYWDQANILSSGAAQPHFNGSAVKRVKFSYPKNIKIQKKLAKEFRKFSIETKKLETIYQQKLTNLEELKKSILQKAFNGELHLIEEFKV